MKTVICKDRQDSVSGLLDGLTVDKIYDVIDTDDIGYFIVDDLGREGWYCKDKFMNLQETREVKLSFFFGENKPIDVMVVDISAGSPFFDKAKGTIINQYMSDDVLDILREECYHIYQTDWIAINSPIYAFSKLISKSGQSSIKHIWRVGYTQVSAVIMAGGTFEIEDLDVKMRDKKIGNIIDNHVTS